jgi:hypothetical protein
MRLLRVHEAVALDLSSKALFTRATRQWRLACYGALVRS